MVLKMPTALPKSLFMSQKELKKILIGLPKPEINLIFSGQSPSTISNPNNPVDYYNKQINFRQENIR